MPPLPQPEIARGRRGLILDPEIIAGGVETLRLELLPRLARRFDKLIWALPPGARERFESELGPQPGLQVEPLDWPRAHWYRWAGALARRTGLRIKTPAGADKLANHLVARFDPDFVMTTCVFDQPPPRTNRPVIGIVCDVNPGLPKRTRANMPGWLEQGASLIAISQFTAGELRKAAPALAHRVSAVPLAAPAPHSGPTGNQTDFTFLFPATANPHKGHLTVFQAVDRLAGEGPRFRVVLTGPGTEALLGTGPLGNATLEKTRQFFDDRRARLAGYISARGAVPRAELAAEFSHASAMLLPSQYEGFGLPLAEGLAAGLPIVCSDIPAYLEQLELYRSQDRALVFGSGDAAGLAQGMRGMLEAPLPRLSRRDAAARLERWSWDDVAEAVAKIIRARV